MASESSNSKKSDRSTGKRDHVVYIDDLKSKSDASASKSDGDKDDEISCTFFHYLAILGICGLVGFYLYKLDEVNYPRISITSVEVSSIKSGGASVSAADIMVGFVSDNSWHGGDEIEEYGDIRASVYYDGSLIASTSVYPFKQDPKEVTERKARMRARNIDWVSKANNNKTHHDAVLSFDITISSSPVHFPRNNIMDLIAFCEGVQVKFTSMTTAGTGSMIGGSKDCRVAAENSQNH